jgi:hypothetical protein
MNRQQRRAEEAKARKAARRLEQRRQEISRPDYNPIHDPEFQQGTAKLVRAIDFKMPSELGDIGGLCMFRTMVGMEALRDCNIEAVPYFGAMLYRVGPDPYRDVIAFCGRHNAAYILDDGTGLFHSWLWVGDYFVDFSVGDWFATVPHILEAPGGEELGPIQWTTPKPPDYWWKPRAELEDPWRSNGTPALGQAWYKAAWRSEADLNAMADRFKRTYRELRDEISAGIRRIKDQFAARHGLIEATFYNPAAAISMPHAQLFTLARGSAPADIPSDELVYVPRLPRDAAEAESLLQMTTITVDATVSDAPLRIYAGYTQDELLRGRPGVVVRGEDQ